MSFTRTSSTSGLEAVQRFLAAQVQSSCAGGFFNDGAPVRWAEREYLIDEALANDDEGVVREVRAGEKIRRSRRRTRERFTRYSASPLRKRRRPTSISVKSMGNRRDELSSCNSASA